MPPEPEDDDAIFRRAMTGLGLPRRGAVHTPEGEIPSPAPAPGAPEGAVATGEATSPPGTSEATARLRDADRALFLDTIAALTEAPDAPEEEPGDAGRATPGSSRRRVGKRLERGEITPERTLDLHGLTRRDALQRVRVFLGAARADGVSVVRLITGRGLHSRDGAKIRGAVRDALRGDLSAHVADVVTPPRSLGGEGAVIVFLRRPAS